MGETSRTSARLGEDPQRRRSSRSDQSGMARAQPHFDLPRRNEIGKQAQLNHRRFCRLLARPSSESHSCHSHHATMKFTKSGAYTVWYLFVTCGFSLTETENPRSGLFLG